MGWTPNHGRIKPKYNPNPDTIERYHEERLKKMPCFGGCGRMATCAHHTLLSFPGKRWRRDHRCQLPLCQSCHQGPTGIHGIGSEKLWLKTVGKTEIEAIRFMQDQWETTLTCYQGNETLRRQDDF